MITEKMLQFLEEMNEHPNKDVKYSVYYNRIQKRVNRELEMLLKLCKRFPDVFLDEEVEINNLSGKLVSHRRMRNLILCVKYLNPHCDLELVKERVKDPNP